MSALPNEPTQIVRLPAARRRSSWPWLASVLLLGALTLVLVRFSGSTHVAVAAGARPLRLSPWPSDTLVVAPDTELSIASRARQLELRSGAVLCDVTKRARPLVVRTAEARVEAQAAVFTAQAELGRTLVRVYEGAVRVGGKRLAAGDTWLSAGLLPEAVPPLDGEAREAAHLLRAQAASPQPPAPRSVAVLDAHTVLSEAQRALAAGNPQRALELLDRARLDDDGSPVRGPAGLVRIDALLALGQPSAARVHALRHLSREPDSAAAARLRTLVHPRP